MTDGDREAVVRVIALLDAVDIRLNRLGGDQVMSVGIPLADVADLQSEIVKLARGYGAIDESATVADLRNEACRTVDVFCEPKERSESTVPGISDPLDDAAADIVTVGDRIHEDYLDAEGAEDAVEICWGMGTNLRHLARWADRELPAEAEDAE